jgi:hypothetical protein
MLRGWSGGAGDCSRDATPRWSRALRQGEEDVLVEAFVTTPELRIGSQRKASSVRAAVAEAWARSRSKVRQWKYTLGPVKRPLSSNVFTKLENPRTSSSTRSSMRTIVVTRNAIVAVLLAMGLSADRNGSKLLLVSCSIGTRRRSPPDNAI